jgi:hypothetical protein
VIASLEVARDHQSMRSLRVRGRRAALLGAPERFVEPAGDEKEFPEPQTSVQEGVAKVLDVSLQLVDGDEIDQWLATPLFDRSCERCTLGERIADLLRAIRRREVPVEPPEVGVDEWRACQFDRSAVAPNPRARLRVRRCSPQLCAARPKVAGPRVIPLGTRSNLL